MSEEIKNKSSKFAKAFGEKRATGKLFLSEVNFNESYYGKGVGKKWNEKALRVMLVVLIVSLAIFWLLFFMGKL